MRGKAIDVKPCFVVKVYSYCFIAWLAEQIAPNIWAPGMGVSALDTTFVLDLNEWEALPTRVRSPIAAAVRKDSFLSECKRFVHVELAAVSTSF